MSLDDIRAREQAATEGPWTYTGRDHQTTWIESPVEDVLIHDERGTGHMRENFSWIKQADAEFIAHARTDIPFLLDERDKLRAALDAVLSVHVEGTFQRLDPQQECKHCRYAWPCVTVRAITEALR